MLLKLDTTLCLSTKFHYQKTSHTTVTADYKIIVSRGKVSIERKTVIKNKFRMFRFSYEFSFKINAKFRTFKGPIQFIF